MALNLIINGVHAALKKDTSFDYVSENRYFTDADDYSMEIELPLRNCPQNVNIFGHISRKDVEAENMYFDAQIQCGNLCKKEAVVITEITHDSVKVQFVEKRSFQNFYPEWDEKYINFLDLGEWPNFIQDNLYEGGMSGRPRPNVNQDDVSAVKPADIWKRTEDFTALPWVNNSTGNMQNVAFYDETKRAFVWKTKADDDEDMNYSTGLSFQPSLLFITKKVCEALGYTYDFSAWENSQYKWLFIMNCLPYTQGIKKWAAVLPHWTINEFFKELEKFLLGEFEINHNNKRVTFAFCKDSALGKKAIYINNVVEEYNEEISEDELSEYKPTKNVGYAEGGNRLDGFNNCNWYFETKKLSDGRISCTEWETLDELINSSLKEDAVKDADSDSRNHPKYPGGKWGLHHAKDVDTYFILEVMERKRYLGYALTEAELYGNVCRLLPINRFGNLIFDKENEDDVEYMNIVPAWLDFADDEHGMVVFLDCEDNDDANRPTQQSHVFSGSSFIEHVDADTVIQFGSYKYIQNGKQEGKSEYFNKIYVAFWDGEFEANKPHLPHPWIDAFEIDYECEVVVGGVNGEGHINVSWRKIFNINNLSLRINSSAYGNYSERTNIIEIDKKRKFSFSFLADDLPDVKAIFYIEGQKYLCEKITATFKNDGLTRLFKGEFYKVIKSN